MRYQATLRSEVSPAILTHIFGPVQAHEEEGRVVYVTRPLELEHLKTLVGTFQSRMERANRSFSGAVVQPEGATPPTRPEAFQVFTPLKVRLDYGDQAALPPATAAEPIEHPSTVVIPPNQYYPEGLTEQQVVDYYQQARDKIVGQYQELQVDGMVKMSVDGKTIMKRHADAQIHAMKLDTPEAFDETNRGRVVEFHFAVGPQTPLAWIDLDPKEEFPFDDVKSVAIALAAELGRTMGDQVSVRFSGRSGMHVVAKLPEPRDTNQVREEVRELVNRFLEQAQDDRLTSEFTSDPRQMRLDYSTLHTTGGLRMPWSLAHPTGLICLPLSPDQVRMFRKEDATISANQQQSGMVDMNVQAVIEAPADVVRLFEEWFRSGQISDIKDPDYLIEYIRERGNPFAIIDYLVRNLPDDVKTPANLSMLESVDEFARTLKRMSDAAKQRNLGLQAAKFDEQLAEYRRKRQPDQTPEPAGAVAEQTEPIFVIQQHEAKRAGLHYDFRLADEGVLKSWAIRHLTSLVDGQKDKVLAVEVEPHPLEYAKFEGSIEEGACDHALAALDAIMQSASIPAGQYGAGQVAIWDQGRYETVSKDAGHWKFNLYGQKLQGTFVLIRTAGDRWLLRRTKDG